MRLKKFPTPGCSTVNFPHSATMKKPSAFLVLVPAALLLLGSGCQTNYNTQRPVAKEGQHEESIVFVRPDSFSIIGTRSLREYVEIVYENSQRNPAGLLKVNTGLRNKGGKWFYDNQAPNFPLSVKTSFFRTPIGPTGPVEAPVYETNWQTVTMTRGATTNYEVVCPLPEARYYQITLSEQIAR